MTGALLPAAEAGAFDLEGMRLVLISLANDVTCVGIRTLAAVLEGQGAVVDVVLLPDSGSRDVPMEDWVEGVLERVRRAHAVGLSVMSIDVPRARKLSAILRDEDIGPLVWGGPYPTLRPRECAAHSDWVCVGDGELFLAELLGALKGDRDPVLPALGVATRPCLDAHVDTAPRLPLPRTWVLHEGRVEPSTVEALRASMATNPPSRDTNTLAYETVASRGCPHACTFCGSTGLDQVSPEKLFRRRGVASVLAELREVLEALPFVTGIGFADDNFLARPLKEIRAFSEGYAVDVGLPLIAIGSPATITEARLRSLVDAGLVRIKMGIQSGSDPTTDVLGRARLNSYLDRALEAIATHNDRMLPPRFDILVDLPFEGLDDRLATLRMIAALPRPYRLELNSLRLMEGTPLHDVAVSDGWHTPDMSVNFKRIAPMYTNLVLAMCREGRLPGRVVRALADPRVAVPLSTGVGDRGLRGLWGLARRARQVMAR